jgi:hypothetical protein
MSDNPELFQNRNIRAFELNCETLLHFNQIVEASRLKNQQERAGPERCPALVRPTGNTWESLLLPVWWLLPFTLFLCLLPNTHTQWICGSLLKIKKKLLNM